MQCLTWSDLTAFGEGFLSCRPLVGVHEGSFQGQGGDITAAEFDRLAFLMQSSAESNSHSADGSPMDISPTPFSGLLLLRSVPEYWH